MSKPEQEYDYVWTVTGVDSEGHPCFRALADSTPEPHDNIYAGINWQERQRQHNLVMEYAAGGALEGIKETLATFGKTNPSPPAKLTPASCRTLAVGDIRSGV